MTETETQTKSKTSRLNLYCIVVVINALFILAYHYFLAPSGNNQIVYTTNAKQVLDFNYKKAIDGKIDEDQYMGILVKMDSKMRNFVNKNPRAIVMPQGAVVMGGQKIIFGPEGDVLTNPDEISKAIKLIEKATFNNRFNGRQVLQDAINQLKGSEEFKGE